MNTDSKLKRFVILLGRAPFILFIESSNPIDVNSLLRSAGLSDGTTAVPLEIHAQTPLFRIFASINKIPDPIACQVVEVLLSSAFNTVYASLPFSYFTSARWQERIEWQNVDTKPEPIIHEYTVTVDRITHELNTIYSKNLESSTRAYDGVVELSSVDINVLFPKALLKECVADIYEIIKVMSMNREPSTIAKSKYMSVVQTGHETFNWCNLKKIEEDLIAVLKSNNIKIEE